MNKTANATDIILSFPRVIDVIPSVIARPIIIDSMRAKIILKLRKAKINTSETKKRLMIEATIAPSVTFSNSS